MGTPGVPAALTFQLKGEGSGPLPPVLQQYAAFKAEHPGYLLLSQTGSFYEAFGEDADISPYSAAGDGMQALQSGTIDAMVMDVDQGMAASTEYFPDSAVIGTLPDEGVVEQYGGGRALQVGHGPSLPLRATAGEGPGRDRHRGPRRPLRPLGLPRPVSPPTSAATAAAARSRG